MIEILVNMRPNMGPENPPTPEQRENGKLRFFFKSLFRFTSQQLLLAVVLTVVGCCWLLSGCYWLLLAVMLAALGCSWLLC